MSKAVLIVLKPYIVNFIMVMAQIKAIKEIRQARRI
jgi:hypothetical protein